MITENNVEEINVKQIPPKKEKNPNRVAGGKKSVEARRKKAELLEKENLQLKENSRQKSEEIKGTASLKENSRQITMDAEEYTPQTIKREKKRETLPMVIDYNLLLYSVIGIGGLGLYIYSQRKNTPQKENMSSAPLEKKENKEKKEIDPFEF